MSEATAELVPGRSCDGCAMCCMLFDIPALQKKAGVWCVHCEGNQRCAAYEVRPQPCRDFFCHYRLEAAVPEHWKPSLSHMVVRSDANGVAIQAHVDPAHPDAWRAEPYYSDLKAWARNRLAGDKQVHVRTGGRTIVILPDRDVDLGDVSNRLIVVQKTWAITGFTVAVSVIDPPPG